MILQFILRRLAWIPLALVVVNFVGFVFAHVTYQIQQTQTIYGSGQDEMIPVWPAYSQYARNMLRLDFGTMPVGVNQPIADALVSASAASLGLLGVAFVISVVLGLALGLSAVRVNATQPAAWLPLISTVGLAIPSFYIGTVMVSLIVMSVMTRGDSPVLPVAGFGWDNHLILPVLALIIRPTMQIAQVTASLLSGELNKRYVVAARSFGHTWRSIRWDKALRNVMAPVFLTIAGSFRLLVSELLLIEWLFSWPGLGCMLVQTLVPPRISSVGGLLDETVFFLHAPLVAGLLVVFSLLFLLADTFASGLARAIDPRMRVIEEEVFNG